MWAGWLIPPEGGSAMGLMQKLDEREKFAAMSQQMSSWVEHVLGSSYHRYKLGKAWSPAINLYEDEKHYCVIVDLGGVKADDIDLRIDGGVMIVSGHRPSPGLDAATGAKRVHLMEIDHGAFVRRIDLPEDVDVDAIQEATYRNGFLWIRLAKRS